MFIELGNFLSQPLYLLADQAKGIPIIYALIIGIVGAMAPGQFAFNIGVITFFGNKSIQQKVPWLDAWLFILGKIVAFSGLGIVLWVFGEELQNLIYMFPWLVKLVGPMLILLGLYMIGIFRIKKKNSCSPVLRDPKGNGKLGSFLFGFSMAFAFCPAIFFLFSVTLMPMAISTSYGFILPSIFAVGSSVPLLIALFIIWYLGFGGTLIKKGQKFGTYIQTVAGIILVLLGVLDIINIW